MEILTSSSIKLIKAWRYSSMVRWKASLSLRLTGTAAIKIVSVMQWSQVGKRNYHSWFLQLLPRSKDVLNQTGLHIHQAIRRGWLRSTNEGWLIPSLRYVEGCCLNHILRSEHLESTCHCIWIDMSVIPHGHVETKPIIGIFWSDSGKVWYGLYLRFYRFLCRCNRGGYCGGMI